MREIDVPLRLVVKSPPLGSVGVDIKRQPMAMQPILFEEGAFLGKLPDIPWQMFFPSNQHVPEKDNRCAHLMLAPVSDHPIDRINEREMTGLLSYLLPFVKEGGTVVGFNKALIFGKKTSQTWGTMHVHAIRLPESKFFELPYRTPKSLREKVYRRVDRVVRWYFLEGKGGSILGLDPGSRAMMLAKNKDQLFPKGGVSFYFRKELDSESWGNFVVRLMDEYQRFYQGFRNMFVDSQHPLELVEQEYRSRLLPLREMEVSIDLQEGRLYPADQKKFLLKVACLLASNRERNIDVPDKLFSNYAYTVVFRRIGDDIRVILSPQIASSRGVLEAIGINVVREQRDGVSNQKRRERARALAEQIMRGIDRAGPLTNV